MPLNAIPIKIPAAFCVDKDKLILEFIRRGKAIQIAKTILKKETNVVLNFKAYYKLQYLTLYGAGIRTVIEINKIELRVQEKKKYIYDQLIFPHEY